MIDEDRSYLHKIMVEKYQKGEISIDVNRNSALLMYSQVSRNPLIKLFHFFIRVYSFPLTILGVVFASVFLDQYLFILYYVVGLFGFISLEEYLSMVTTVNSVLDNQHVFSKLQRRGIIHVRDIVDPNSPV